jgi:hypothetical protein
MSIHMHNGKILPLPIWTIRVFIDGVENKEISGYFRGLLTYLVIRRFQTE